VGRRALFCFIGAASAPLMEGRTSTLLLLLLLPLLLLAAAAVLSRPMFVCAALSLCLTWCATCWLLLISGLMTVAWWTHSATWSWHQVGWVVFEGGGGLGG
jgi:hypothetical protein